MCIKDISSVVLLWQFVEDIAVFSKYLYAKNSGMVMCRGSFTCGPFSRRFKIGISSSVQVIYLSDVKTKLYRDKFENARQYNIPRAQFIIADIQYNISSDIHVFRPGWCNNGDIKQDESRLAHKTAYNTDHNFNITDFLAFATRLLKKEPAKCEKGAPYPLTLDPHKRGANISKKVAFWQMLRTSQRSAE